LSDENGTIRSRAALALRQLHDERAVMPLIEALRVEKDEKIRSWIINSFGVLGDTRAVEPLIEALNDPGENNRNLAIECLGILRDRKAFEPLTGVINQKTSNEKTRGLAMKALVQLGSHDGRFSRRPHQEENNEKRFADFSD
jgi:HEAT repeat protein